MNEQTPQPVPDPDDDIRRGLIEPGVSTSAAHDESVLARAQVAAGEISARRPRSRRPVWLLPAAAALAAVLLVPLFVGEPGDALRGPQDVVTPAHNAQLAAAPAHFEWPFVPGATAYEVVLRDAGAAEVWRSGETTAQRVATDEVRGLTADGGTFLWTVEVTVPGGTTELGPYQFTIAEQ